jgi:DNA polymerase I-like protein with 3'-5' exonuclease and polymerase domains
MLEIPTKIAIQENNEMPDVSWNLPLNLPTLQNAKHIAIDLETCDPNLKKFGPGWATNDGVIAGISIAIDNAQHEITYSEYFPINHKGGDNLDEATVINWLKKELSTDIPKVFANNYYDCGWLAAYGVHVKGPWYDIQIAAPILDEHKWSYSLDNLGLEYCNERKDERLLEEYAQLNGIDARKIKELLWTFPSRLVAPYAIQDAVLTLKVWHVLEPMLKDEGLWSVFEMETKLSPILIKMRMKGVRVDTAKRDKLIEELTTREKAARLIVNETCGFSLDIWSAKNIVTAYDAVGVDYGYTKASIKKGLLNAYGYEDYLLDDGETLWLKEMFDSPVPIGQYNLKSFIDTLTIKLDKTQIQFYKEKYGFNEENPIDPKVVRAAFDKFLNPSVTNKFLDQQPDAFSTNLRLARKWNKVVSAFLNNSFTDQVVNGRIYCCYHQLKKDEGGTITGRFSCSNPNLQQVPIRDPEIGPIIRSLFIPEEGKLWGSFDYSAQEPRILLHYCNIAEEHGFIGTDTAQHLRQIYVENPRTDSHQAIADLVTNMYGNIMGETNKQRRQAAKTINLGKAYVMGLRKLAMNLGISEEEAKPIIDAYEAAAPHIKAFQKYADKQAATRGFVKSVLNRKLHFTFWEPKLPFGDNRMVKAEKYNIALGLSKDPSNEVWYNRPLKRSKTYKAINSIVQGSAADMTKLAMIKLDEAGYTPVLQVHDELNFSDLTSMAQVEEIKKIMEEAVLLTVPIVCDAKLGENWGTTH